MIKDLSKIILSYMYQDGQLLLDIPNKVLRDLINCPECNQNLFKLWKLLDNVIENNSYLWKTNNEIYFKYSNNICKISASICLFLYTHEYQTELMCKHGISCMEEYHYYDDYKLIKKTHRCSYKCDFEIFNIYRNDRLQKFYENFHKIPDFNIIKKLKPAETGPIRFYEIYRENKYKDMLSGQKTFYVNPDKQVRLLIKKN